MTEPIASQTLQYISLRHEQAAIVCDYAGGRLAVSAVPGSGKTHTLAALAVELIANRLRPLAEQGDDEREVLIVTFTNSAVENFRSRIRALLRARDLPDGGYRVCTLHSLARLILDENPTLAGTDSDYRLADEISSNVKLGEITRAYIEAHRAHWLSFLSSDVSDNQRSDVERRWQEATATLAREVIRLAKNRRLTPEKLQEMLGNCDPNDSRLAFLRIGAEIYLHYERVLRAAGQLDFDDLIVGALRVLEGDEALRHRLSHRWCFILEDEAQDSTPLQQAMLELLSRDHGNWVRVGDPNQAIMTTFTASDVRLFRAFCHDAQVTFKPLSVTGRCAQPIMDFANWLARWAAQEHPVSEVRAQALDDCVTMQPTPQGDPQQNPSQACIRVLQFESTDRECSAIAQHAANFVQRCPSDTCAILVPTNWLGDKVVEKLEEIRRQKKLGNLYQEYLRNTRPVRDLAETLAACVEYCAEPGHKNKLAHLWASLAGASREESLNGDKKSNVAPLLRSVQVEEWLFPSHGEAEFLTAAIRAKSAAEDLEAVRRFGERVRPWVQASVLPPHQLVLLIAQDLFAGDDHQLALASSIAANVRDYVNARPSEVTLADVALLLREIARNERRYVSDALREVDFQPRPGQITVTTLHKAKGLEWDRVYVVNVTSNEFPHDPGAGFRGELWFLRDQRDPATEARVALEALADGTLAQATADKLIRAAREEYIAERLRLLYVAITRARRDLILSFSKNAESGKTLSVAEAVQIYVKQKGQAGNCA